MTAVFPLLSIVIVTHNRSELLKRALSSVLKCQKDGYEIILCADDNSKETIEVAKELLRAQDSFLRVPSMKGPAESRNLGAKLARGKWITFLDDDDTFGSEHINKILDVLPNEKNKVLYFNYEQILEKREASHFIPIESNLVDISKREPINLLINNFIPMHAMVFSSELITKHTFDIHLQSHEDWDFLISLYTSGVEFEWIDFGSESVVVHIDSSNTSRNKTAIIALDYLSIYRKWPSEHVSIQQARAENLKRKGIGINFAAL